MRLPALAVLSAALAAPLAADEPPPAERGFLSFTFENDKFGGRDQDYTNGVRAGYTSPRNDLPLWGRFARRNLTWLNDAENWHVGYAVGQNIYTATDITDPDPPLDDRPYAGFLYVSASIIADRGDRLDTLALDLGVVGPAARAEQVQTIVHDLINVDEPEGWDTQLGNEPGVRLLYERKRRFGARFGVPRAGLEADWAPHVSAALGNVDTSLAAGATGRIGQDLADDYGPPRIRPAVAGPGFFRGEGLSWYLFAGAEGRLVGRNIFLEGNTFRDSRSVEPRRLVADLQAGAAVQLGRAQLTYTQVFRSPEYDGQQGFAVFGSVNLRVRF